MTRPVIPSSPGPDRPVTTTAEMSPQERIAREFHATYERKEPAFGYKTREASAVPWDQVPEANRALMVAVVKELLEDGVIHA